MSDHAPIDPADVHDPDPLTIDALVHAFEAGRLDGTDFPHRRHVKVAWGLAQRYEHEEAFARLAAGIRGIATRAGRPDVYHQTITRAWFELISSSTDPASDPELFDKAIINRYYSPARQAAGREEWLEPDLHPLDLPPPLVPPAIPVADVLRRVPTAVAILATRASGTVHATTISSFTSVSRDPALVSICLANGSRALELLADAPKFTISVLASDQDELASRFAQIDRPAGALQFRGVPHYSSDYGPVIGAAAAWLGCRFHAMHRCGDHHLVIGEIEQAEATEQRPLVRHDGAYH